MQDTIPAVLELVRQRTGVDFSRYREATVQRRVQNHMVATGMSAPADYLRMLQQTPDATKALLERLTIKVSAFYRNPVACDELRATVIPELRALHPDRPLEIWSAGCGRGEEPYTLAMLMDEAQVACNIIATDIDESALRAAHDGVYETSSVASLPEDLAARYLDEIPGQGRSLLRVKPMLRSSVTFLRHDLTAETPPLPGTFDLLCCRNVLIYLQRDLHHVVLHQLRSAVRHAGYLCLGEAEWPSPDIMATLSPLARKTRLFRASMHARRQTEFA